MRHLRGRKGEDRINEQGSRKGGTKGGHDIWREQ